MQTKQIPALFGKNPSKPNKVKVEVNTTLGRAMRRPDEQKCALLRVPKDKLKTT